MSKIQRFALHPACKLFPKLGETELNELADDIKQNGLQNSIVLLDGKILDGRNRFAACKIADVQPRFEQWKGKGSPVEWVISQNLMRRHLTASQRAVVALDLLPLLEKEAKERQRLSRGRGKKVAQECATFSENGNGKASAVAARIVRSSARYVEMVKQISLDAPELIEQLRLGELNISQAKRMATIQQQQATEKKAARNTPRRKTWTITADQRVVECHAIVADPPYGISTENWEPDDLEAFTRDWCQRWSKCEADFIAIFWSQEKLWEGRRWFDGSLDGYRFQQLLTWHANNNGDLKSRRMFKQTWEPIFLYRRVGSNRQIICKDKSWDTDTHNFDCCVAPVPQTNYNGHDLKQHPAQKPVAVMRWLIHALTKPNEKVVSPFCGVAPCGIAAVELGRKYHGIEINRRYRKIAEARIAAYGKANGS